MKPRSLLLLLPTLGCHPWFLEHAAAPDAGSSEVDASDTSSPSTSSNPSNGGDVPDAPQDALAAALPFAEADAGEGMATPLAGALAPDQQVRAVAALVAQPGWGSDADAGTSTDSQAALPPAGAPDGALALAPTLASTLQPKGCGEPPLCFLRVAIRTSTGRLYTARLSSTYPDDMCGRDVVNDGKNILIGDPGGRFGDLRCSTSSPQITMGFVIPNQVLGTTIERHWLADDGFRSQWTIAGGAPGDNGLYVPEPSKTSTLDLLWLGRSSKGEAYGSLVVPVYNKATRAAALGELIFDVRIR